MLQVLRIRLSCDVVSWLPFSAALTTGLGCPGELLAAGNLSSRWMYWALATLPVLHTIYDLLDGLATASKFETDWNVAALRLRLKGDGVPLKPG
jgi:hypothetical protein